MAFGAGHVSCAARIWSAHSSIDSMRVRNSMQTLQCTATCLNVGLYRGGSS